MSVDLLDTSLGGDLVERPTILLVEDDPQIREILSGLLGALGSRLLMAAAAQQALDAVNVVSPDLVPTDVHLGAMSGELCARLTETVALLMRETDAGYWDPRIVDTFLDVLRNTS